jgi:DNA-binding CsgD family transcriptional regulator
VSNSDDLARARDALRTGRWAEAASSFADVAAATDAPEAHEGLAQAAWWIDDATLTLTAREAAYRGYRTAGDDRGAARTAATLGYDSILFGSGVAVGRGWLARAADVLAGRVDVPEAGWLAVREAEVALNVDHDPLAGADAAARAEQVGRALHDPDLVIVARALAGLAGVRLGRIENGMRLLDAAAAAATAGDVTDLMWTGKICCWLISGCQDVHDLERAQEWCARVEEISVRRRLEPLFVACRTQYASVLLARGDADGAESALVDVLARLGQSRRLSRVDAVAELGELRRRQGRLSEAEELLGQAGYLPAARISLARLKLERGAAHAAWSIIDELLRSNPSEQQVERVDALTVAVEAGLAAGHREEATAAAEELRAVAQLIPTDAFRAQVAAADARLADPAGAVPHWQDAARLFHTAGLSFDEADARLELAELLAEAGDRAGAEEQAARAAEVLLPLHASHALERTRSLLPTAATGTLTERQNDVLRLLARGLSNADIAEQLHLSEHTVHRHIANIYRALDVGSRAAAASYAARHGLI